MNDVCYVSVRIHIHTYTKSKLTNGCQFYSYYYSYLGQAKSGTIVKDMHKEKKIKVDTLGVV